MERDDVVLDCDADDKPDGQETIKRLKCNINTIYEDKTCLLNQNQRILYNIFFVMIQNVNGISL